MTCKDLSDDRYGTGMGFSQAVRSLLSCCPRRAGARDLGRWKAPTAATDRREAQNKPFSRDSAILKAPRSHGYSHPLS